MSVIHYNLFHLKWEMGYQLSLSLVIVVTVVIVINVYGHSMSIILDIQEQIMEINVIVFVSF